MESGSTRTAFPPAAKRTQRSHALGSKLPRLARNGLVAIVAAALIGLPDFATAQSGTVPPGLLSRPSSFATGASSTNSAEPGLAVARDGGDIVLRFKDAGAGIPRDMLERIFEPFTQVQRPRDAALGGLGLGLALVKKLVELHGGTVRAASEGPGKGSEFVVRLPALQSAAAEEPVADRAAADVAVVPPQRGEPAAFQSLRIHT